MMNGMRDLSISLLLLKRKRKLVHKYFVYQKSYIGSILTVNSAGVA